MQFIQRISDWFQKRTSSRKERMILYSIVGALMIGSMCQLKSMGYTSTILLLQNVMPKHQTKSIGTQLFYKWLYTLTDIDWEHPNLLIMNLTPYQKSIYMEKVASGEIKGYFDQDENTYLNQVENEIYTPQEPKVMNAQDYIQFKDTSYVYSHYMSAPGKMEFDLDMLAKWNFYDLINQPISIDTSKNEPKVLIFHTHAREEYIGGKTVVDVAEALKETLEKQYGIKVLHVTDSFYEASNQGNRPTGGEYERMEPVIRKVLEENPSISVVIDLHRDGVNEGVHLVTDINGKQTAKIMFVNGLCLNRNIAGEVEEKEDLPNPYIGDNLAFSLQSVVKMNELYPGLSRKIYLNEWRYSTHMRPYSLLMEWGAQTNTSEEAMNAVEPVAEILAKVLQKD